MRARLIAPHSSPVIHIRVRPLYVSVPFTCHAPGQWRRIVVPGIGAEAYNPNNRSWVIGPP